MADTGLSLGDLSGNRFSLVLRALPDDVTDESVLQSVRALSDRGFINYFGLQRFGRSAVSTHHIGAHILRGDFEAAVDALLGPEPNTRSAA